MRIRRITIRDFGAVRFWDAALTRSLNIIDSHYTREISAAIALFLCSKAQQVIPSTWIRSTTHLCAEVLAQKRIYTVTATPGNDRLTLTATDDSGTAATDAYQYMLSHCPEQDATDRFDGQDKTLPLRLCWYRNGENAPVDLAGATQRRTELNIFRSHLIGYIKAFQPEPIHCRKNYLITINKDGCFSVICPGVPGRVSLSETEKKLFHYNCFLHIAEFWANIERLRDLHHEKKPLVIQNFLEYLDASTDISALLARTAKLRRQIILLTLPCKEDEKHKWMEGEDPYGIFFEFSSSE